MRDNANEAPGMGLTKNSAQPMIVNVNIMRRPGQNVWDLNYLLTGWDP